MSEGARERGSEEAWERRASTGFFAVRVEFVAGARETRRKPAQPADCTTEVADCTTEVAEPWRRDAHVAKEL